MLCSCSVPGVGSVLLWSATAAGNGGPLSVFPDNYVSSYAHPTVRSVVLLTPPTMDTRGGEKVVIYGSNFGTTLESDNQLVVSFIHAAPVPGAVTFFGSNCAVNTSHVAIVCTTPTGVGAQLVWSVYIDGQWSYNPTYSSSRLSVAAVAPYSTSYTTPVVRSRSPRVFFGGWGFLGCGVSGYCTVMDFGS